MSGIEKHRDGSLTGYPTNYFPIKIRPVYYHDVPSWEAEPKDRSKQAKCGPIGHGRTVPEALTNLLRHRPDYEQILEEIHGLFPPEIPLNAPPLEM